MIVVLSHAHPSVSKGGAEVAAYSLYTGLLRLGHRAAFVAMCPDDKVALVKFETPNEHVVPFQTQEYDPLFHHAPPEVFGTLRRLLERIQPEALVFHHFLYLGINTIERLLDHFSCRSALVLHEFLAICQHHGQMVTHPDKRLCASASPSRCAACFPELKPDDFNVRNTLFRTVLGRIDRLISPSAFLARRFEQWGLPPEKFSVIENGLTNLTPSTTAPVAVLQAVRPSLPKRATPPQGWRRWLPTPAVKPPVVFGYFGQINPFKGVDLLLDAAQLLEGSEVALKIRIHGNLVGVGEAFQERFLAACAKEGGILEYAGPYENTDVLRLMGACDFVLMASRWWENSPVVIQEAYAAGRPLVVPGIGGMAEKVKDGLGGRHFLPGDANDLARVLLACAHEGRAAYQLPRPLTSQEMAQRYLLALGVAPAAPPARPAEVV